MAELGRVTSAIMLRRGSADSMAWFGPSVFQRCFNIAAAASAPVSVSVRWVVDLSIVRRGGHWRRRSAREIAEGAYDLDHAVCVEAAVFLQFAADALNPYGDFLGPTS